VKVTDLWEVTPVLEYSVKCSGRTFPELPYSTMKAKAAALTLLWCLSTDIHKATLCRPSIIGFYTGLSASSVMVYPLSTHF
jgi:hypothetical protein